MKYWQVPVLSGGGGLKGTFRNLTVSLLLKMENIGFFYFANFMTAPRVGGGWVGVGIQSCSYSCFGG